MNAKTRETSYTKFHSIFGSVLKVALETTFPSSSEIKVIGDWDGRNVGFVHRNGFCQKIYHPAYTNGDVSERESRVIDFISWVDGTEAQGHRLCLRAKVKGGKFSAWIKLARFEEDKVFGFEDPKKPYVNLDFFSRRSESFIPVYVKIIIPSAPVTYLGIEGNASDEAVSLIISRLGLKSVPKILADFQPQVVI